VFGIGEDPVKAGLVSSLNRPGGNMTGATFLSAGLGAKRLGMMRQLVPDANVIGLLANQNSPQGQEQLKDVPEAAKSLSQRLVVLKGGNDQEIDAAFASLAGEGVKAMLVAADPAYDPRRNWLIALSCMSDNKAKRTYAGFWFDMRRRGIFTLCAVLAPQVAASYGVRLSAIPEAYWGA
jgi:putative ABC transport system substrate-binding protein